MIGTIVLGLAVASSVDVYGELGGQFDSDSHGVVNLGLRTGPLKFELLTDTLQVAYEPARDGGRAWVMLRVQGFAAEMLTFPWTDGAPDPTSALIAPKLALDAGWVDYLAGGFYVGVAANARGYLFFEREETSIEVPDPTARFSPAAFVGWWHPSVSIEIGGRAHLGGDRVGAGVEGRAQWAPDWIVAPHLELRFGAAENLDFLTRTRLGGLNPYVVPLAGAGWAEWWVEDYVAARAGATGHLGPVDVRPFVDLVHFDGQSEIGVGLHTKVTIDEFFVTVIGGYAPNIERGPDVLRFSVWALAGTSWMSF